MPFQGKQLFDQKCYIIVVIQFLGPSQNPGSLKSARVQCKNKKFRRYPTLTNEADIDQETGTTKQLMMPERTTSTMAPSLYSQQTGLIITASKEKAEHYAKIFSAHSL